MAFDLIQVNSVEEIIQQKKPSSNIGVIVLSIVFDSYSVECLCANSLGFLES